MPSLPLRPPHPPETPDHGSAGHVGGYEVAERLGAGAHADVWRARRPPNGPWVALKVARRAPDADWLRHEAQLTGRLTHPGILPVLDLVELDDGRVALARPLAMGSVADLLHEPLAVRVAAGLLAPVARALAAAHALAVVHGDVAPGNVLITADGKALLGDFGAAGPDPGRSAATPGFRPPEGRPSPAGDVFGVGRLLTALTGLEADELPPGLAAATDDDPDLRPSASELAERLAVAGEGAPDVRPPDPPFPSAAEPDPATATVTREFGPRPPAATDQPPRPFRVPPWVRRIGALGRTIRTSG